MSRQIVNSSSINEPPPHSARQRWMGVLARAKASVVAEHLAEVAGACEYAYLRPPEPGAVMVQARAGGGGAPFNLGEMTVTRCSVRLADGTVGHGYVQGRDRRHAELAAVADALLQDEVHNRGLMRDVIEPLAQAQADARNLRSREAAATRVDFFTLVRGEDPK